MTQPMEKHFAELLTAAGVDFIRPENLSPDEDETTLDYYLPAFDLYVELKAYHSPRIATQLARVPRRANALVLMGPHSVAAFARLVERLSGGKP
jgi:hypothetical protein